MRFSKFGYLLILILSFAGILYSQIDYSNYDSVLQKYVIGNKVNYKQLMTEKEKLFDFTGKLGEISPNSDPEKFKDRNEQLAYWINAYNAFILRIILENYPVDSIKDINFIGFTIWLNKNLIGGEKISCKSLEDDIIREGFKDPRIHFAINCASFSCPPLINKAYLPETLNTQMDESSRSFINNSSNFMVDEAKNKIFLSSIFNWYDDDFFEWLKKHKDIEEPHLLDYIKLYYNKDISEKWYTYEIEFTDYDWRLNDYH